MLIKKIREFNNGLAGLYNKNLPFKVSYAVQKNRSNISIAIELAAKKQDELINKYGEKDDKGNFVPSKDEQGNVVEGTINVQKDKIAEFVKEMSALEDEDVDVEIMTVTMEEVEKCDNDRYDTLTPKDMETLMLMIKEE